MAKEKGGIATPNSEEIAAWVEALGFRKGSRVHVVSEMTFYPTGEIRSFLSSPGHYDGVTKGRKIRLYTPPNSVLGTKERHSLVEAAKVFSIQRGN